MAKITRRSSLLKTFGDLPQINSKAPSFVLVKPDLSGIKLNNFMGKFIVLNIFPSLDTPTCAMSVMQFNQHATALPNTTVLCVSMDLPFAMRRFAHLKVLKI